MGAESAQSLLLLDEFTGLKRDIKISTDDGSKGYHGLVTELLAQALEEGRLSHDMALYACGPEPMLGAIVPICEKYNIPAQVSIERRMACGMGVCL